MPENRSVSFHLSRNALWVVAFLLLAPWGAFVAWMVVHRPAPAAAAAPAVAPPRPAEPVQPATASDVQQANPGPWGRLSYYRILIEPPEEFVAADLPEPGIPTWIFKGYNEAALAALWDTAQLTASQRAFVADATHREVRAEAIHLRPDRDFIIALSPESRARIYTALSEFEENFAQYNPYRLRVSAAGDWLEGIDAPADAIALTQRMFYPRGNALCFSDETVVLPTIADTGQRIRYLKALARKSALVVQLTVEPRQDIDSLLLYWGRGGRSKDLKPLLQSMARRPNGGSIDIMHLLPRFARQHVYTYPLPNEGGNDLGHDCHWTSFNFENDTPDERFTDSDYVRRVLQEKYYPVLGEPRFGDLVMFVRKDQVVLHSCVYIADDIVFTKNGPACSIPWLLSTLADVKAFYGTSPGIEIRRFRPKG